MIHNSSNNEMQMDQKKSVDTFENYDCIRPGQVWLDTGGKRIQAHGASVFYENGVFYWYGENKEFTSKKNSIWTWGIRCYSSKDLYNWTDEGLIISPEPDNEQSILHPSRYMDRPHIIFHKKSKKYVCWLKYCDTNHFAVLTADHFLGPYTIVNKFLQPFGRECGDFDLAVDENTGKGYLFFEADHKDLLVTELSENYTDVSESFTIVYESMNPPYTREGVTHFERRGKHYIVTSGMTGYMPNPSEVAVGNDWFGPFTVQGNPHVDDHSRASFNSQISCIFKHPDIKDLYIAVADRWAPDFVVTADLYERLARVVAANFDSSIQVSVDDQLELLASPMVAHTDTSVADYVWLPIRFEGDRVRIDWYDEWRVDS